MILTSYLENSMSWLDKLMNGHKGREERAKEDSLETYKAKLKGIVYDDELVNELAPLFAKLHGQEGFDKVFELLETKEQQIAAISGGDWHSQHTDLQHNEEPSAKEEPTKKTSLTAEQILENKYKETK